MINGGLVLHDESFGELAPATLYALLRLRVDIFVVEQSCPYPELDGRDDEPGTRHLWLAPESRPAEPYAYLRVLIEADGTRRIGRVCTAPAGRGAGLSSRLLAAALTAPGAYELTAQSHLTGFYARFGFQVSGPEHDEDGIPHTPMRREPAGIDPHG
jgi:ElaA protein